MSLPPHDNSKENSGAVYVYSRINNDWNLFTFIKANNGDVEDEFGYKVSLYKTTLVVSAPFEDSRYGKVLYDGSTSDDNSVENSGAVYIYDKTENKLNASAFIKSPIPEKNELFGSSISLDGNNLAVGASGNSENTGAVYIYNRKNSLWTLEQKLTDPFGSGSDEYGYSVDLDNTTLVVGSPKEDNFFSKSCMKNATKVHGIGLSQNVMDGNVM